MIPEKGLAYVALAWLIGAVLVMMRSVRRGRELAESLATRHPDLYEALGRPLPGYLESARRTRWARWLGRREFAELEDGALVAELEAHRKAEARRVISILAIGAVIAAVLVVQRTA